MIQSEWFFSPWYIKVLLNTTQLLEAERKLICIVHSKAFLFMLDNILLLIYTHIFVILSHKLLHMLYSQGL